MRTMNLRKTLLLIGILVLLGVGSWYLFFRTDAPVSLDMSGEEARSIAQASQCAQKGAVDSFGTFSSSLNTWSFNLTVNPEFVRTECNPACIVSAATRTADIDWRCTGLVSSSSVRVSLPQLNQVIKSPFSMVGEATGGWYFEGSFPIQVIDANGNVLGSGIATAQGDWMTEKFVPFTATITFSTPSVEQGSVVFKKDNPSGLPENDDALRVPVRFDMAGVPTRAVSLFYFDAGKDTDASGNIMCSRTGLSAVTRNIPRTTTPIQDAIRLLLRGTLTPQERAQGITTEFPLPGFELKSASLTKGELTLGFVDPQGATGGGSCRVGILWFQIEATAKQFSEVTSVKFMPAELFQP
jgi:hypothetical protein